MADVATRRDIVNRVTLRLLGRNVALTDLTTISNLRILLESILEEFALLHAGIPRWVRRWYVQTAPATYLDRRLADYGLTRPGPQAAYGQVSVTVDGTTLVSAGTMLRTDSDTPQRFRVAPNPAPRNDELGNSWLVEGSRLIDVVAVDTGLAGNAASHTVTVAENPIENLLEADNPTPILNGRDAYTDEEFRQYFRDWLLSLTRGTAGSILFGLQQYTDPTGRRVHSAALEEWGGATLLTGDVPVALKVYIEEGASQGQPGAALASSSLVAAVQKLIDGSDGAGGLRAAGVPTLVQSALALSVPVNLKVDVDRAYNVQTVTAQVRERILAHFGAQPVSGRTVRGDTQGQFSFARLVNVVEDTQGVLRSQFTAPVADIAVPTGQKLVCQTVLVTGAPA